mgnify:CR=1 FL=1|tara:strand:+ start:1109 stop:1555 length:447 start_codon:yes stop_codon:yes gene_type:complete
MASNITYPDKHAAWFIEGNNLCLITNLDATGNTNSTGSVQSGRKLWKAIQESVTDGILIYYQSEPNKVTSNSDYPDIDNNMHKSLVDYVKKCLYMDKAGKMQDPGQAQLSIAMANMHEKNWIDASKRFGMKKRDKTGGVRTIKPFNML